METTTIVRPGRNCWCLERADRFLAIQDGDYFSLVREALLRARRSIFIVGWDILGTVDLLPQTAVSDAPKQLDKLIAYIARRRPELRCYILIWDYALLYTMERDPFSRWRLGWRTPRHVRFGFDDHHPVGGCHHQKIVVIDDRLAFCGGMDLTGHRWDTVAHRADEPARMTPKGEPYGPYHEVQAMVDGPVAARLGALARDRWRAAGERHLPPIEPSAEDLWPRGVTPDFTGVSVALARTVPGSATTPGVRECEALFLDAIATARQTIYIENQYFTNRPICDALAARLSEADGPEVILVLPRGGDGWLERNTIERFRDQAIRCLIAADAYKRLRIVFPRVSREPDVTTFIHSKVTIVDEALLRIGSANLNHRSMGMDSECDLAVDAAGNPEVQAGIRRIRDRLIAEHLGQSAGDVAAAMERYGSVRALIDAHLDREHTLVPFDPPAPDEPELPEAVRVAVDPDEPIGFDLVVNPLVPPLDATYGRMSLRVWIVPSAAILAAIIVASLASESFRLAEFTSVRHAIEVLRRTPSIEVIAVGVFLAAAAVMIPLEVVVLAAGVLLGARRGVLTALAGSMLAAMLGYAAGRLIGPEAIGRWVSRRSYRSGRQLGAQGIEGVVVLRLAAGASAGAIHLLCGAARVPFGAYMAGTAIGLAPAIAALGVLGDLLGEALLHPTIRSGAIAIGTAVLVGGVAFALRAFVLIRRSGPSLSRHRARAEFG